MNEEELLLAHAAATHDVDVDIDVDGDVYHDETPSLRTDSGSVSPSPPTGRSRSSSSHGSLPPTPLLGAEADMNPALWEITKHGPQSTELHVMPTTPIQPR